MTTERAAPSAAPLPGPWQGENRKANIIGAVVGYGLNMLACADSPLFKTHFHGVTSVLVAAVEVIPGLLLALALFSPLIKMIQGKAPSQWSPVVLAIYVGFVFRVFSWKYPGV